MTGVLFNRTVIKIKKTSRKAASSVLYICRPHLFLWTEQRRRRITDAPALNKNCFHLFTTAVSNEKEKRKKKFLSFSLSRSSPLWGRGYRFWLRTSCDSGRLVPRPTPSSLTAPAAHQTTERNTKVHPPALTVTTFGEGICFGGPVIIRQSSVSLSDVVDTPKQYYAYDCRRQYNGVLLAIEEEFESNRSMHTPPQFPPSYHLIDFTGLKVGRQKIEGENEKKKKRKKGWIEEEAARRVGQWSLYFFPL